MREGRGVKMLLYQHRHPATCEVYKRWLCVSNYESVYYIRKCMKCGMSYVDCKKALLNLCFHFYVQHCEYQEMHDAKLCVSSL